MKPTTISVPGLARDMKILHVTDTHLCRADAGSIHEAATARRAQDWRRMEGEDYEQRSIAVLKKGCDKQWDAVLLTGDIIDFPSRSSVELANGVLKTIQHPRLYISGNHDWNFSGQLSNAAYRDENLPLLKPLFGARPAALFDRLEIAGLQILSVDNSTYQIQPAQLEFVRDHLKTGQPTLLMMHIPMGLPELRIKTIAKWGHPILMGEKIDETIHESWGIGPAVPETGEFIELTKNAKNLRGIFCGHVHFEHEERWSDSAIQYVTAPGFEGKFREIDVRSDV